MGYISAKKPFTSEWLSEHLAYDAGRQDEEKRMEDTERRDLDETRRLLYGAMAASRTRKWEVVGTLANALLHHSGLSEQAPQDLIDRLVTIVEQQGTDGAWLLDRIAEVTARLEASPPA